MIGYARMKSKPVRLLLKTLRILLIVWLCLSAAAALFYPKLLYHPSRTLTGPAPDKAGAPYEEFRLRAADGVELHGWRVPAHPGKTGGTLLVFHGNAGDLTTATHRLTLYSSFGWDVYMVDYHGFGQSEGSPSEENLYLDADALWQYVTEERGVNTGEIVIMGYSLGGAVAAYLAEQHPEVAGLVLESTFTNLADVADSLFPWLPCRLILGDAYDTETRLAKLSLPLLVAHGRGDQLVAYTFGRELFEKYTGEKSFLILGDDHNIGYILSGDAYRDGIGAFLRKTGPAREKPHP